MKEKKTFQEKQMKEINDHQNSLQKMLKEAKCQWLTPVILAAWEGEIKRMAV
jgi:hypothetical protein